MPSTSESSGVVTYVVNAALALGESRCKVVGEPDSALAHALSGDIALIPAGGGRLGLARALARSHSRFAFVQAHGPRSLFAARLARVPTSRLGYVFHEIRGPKHKAELRLLRGARLAANTQATARWVGGELQREVEALPPILHTPNALSAQEARARLAIPTDSLLVIGVVGRLSAVKYPSLAIDAVACSRLPARIVFVGDGPERQPLAALAAARDVPILLAGNVPEASKLVRAFDVLLSCSPRETFGLAAAEAMVANVPVVAVDSPGLRELTDGGRRLNLLAPDAAVIAAELSRALSAGSAPQGLGDYVLSKFGLQASAIRLRKYYADAVSGTEPASSSISDLSEGVL